MTQKTKTSRFSNRNKWLMIGYNPILKVWIVVADPSNTRAAFASKERAEEFARILESSWKRQKKLSER